MNKWIKDCVFYQIYPTSFYDSNGDGIGDFKGITQKLYYVKSLGIGGIWFNPFYPSPFMDGGYDVADYCAVNEMFGTMEDFEEMLAKCKSLGIKVIIDLVIGHSSDKHPWFQESGKDEINKYTDRYIWTDSNFNKKDSIHGLYPRDGGYVINYYACQPALNFGYNRLPAPGVRKDAYDLGEEWKMHYTDERLKPLREDLLDIMRFWLNKGVDGFRVDLANSLVKGCVYNSDKDEDVEGLKWIWGVLMGAIRKEYPEVTFVAEWVYPSNSVGKCGFDLDYLGHDKNEYNELLRYEKGTNILPAFEQGNTYFSADGKGNVENFLSYTARLYNDVAGKGYFSVPSGYHDIVRVAEHKDEEVLKTMFAFLLTYKHVPFIYYGDEIGMTHRFGINKHGGYIRTGARTPMQWTDGKNRGFSDTDGELYLPVNDKATQSVEEQETRENSLLNTVRKLVKFRNENPALNADADLKVLLCENGGYPLVYERSNEDKAFVVAINPATAPAKVDIYGKIIFSQNCEMQDGKLLLKGKSFAIMEK